MCWSEAASVAMVGIGGAATAVTWMRGDHRAVPLALGYFTLMEGLQALGYTVVDQCGTPANRAITLLSYLHIVFQPLVINAFAMTLVPGPVPPRIRRIVWWASGLSAAVMLAQLLPVEALGRCLPGQALCGETLCLVSGSWHIAWDVPYNGLLIPLGELLGLPVSFPTYIVAVFLVPLLYGAWRFALFHLLAGPVLAYTLTSDPNEWPAVWCLFSIGICLIALSPAIRRPFRATGRPVWAGSARG